MQVSDEMVRVALAAYTKVLDDLSTQSCGAAVSLDDIREAGLRAALTAALAAMWRDMDSAPKDGERILLGFRGSMSAEGYWHDGSRNHWDRAGWYFSDDDVLTGRPCDPDCWQTLPSPPKAEG